MDKEPTVFDAMREWNALGSRMLTVRPERCVRVRNRHASCRRCVEACTSGAIANDEGELHIDADLCVGCGTCATVCPTGALEMHHPNDESLLQSGLASARENGGTAVFACQPAATSDQVAGAAHASVVCLSRLEETLIVSLFAKGAKHIEAVRADCSRCPRACGLASVELVERTVQELRRVWGIAATYEVREVEAPASAYGSVQAAASNAAGGEEPAREADGAPAEQTKAPAPLFHVTQDGTLPHFVPERREDLLDALAELGEPCEDVLESRLWGHIVIDRDACSSCRMCAVFCPTGAIAKFHDADGTIGIEHYVAECVHCCLCQDVCPESAIVSQTQVPAQQLAHSDVERYPMDPPAWESGPDQILMRMQTKIGGREVASSYGVRVNR